jgi:hypothetical protein
MSNPETQEEWARFFGGPHGSPEYYTKHLRRFLREKGEEIIRAGASPLVPYSDIVRTQRAKLDELCGPEVDTSCNECRGEGEVPDMDDVDEAGRKIECMIATCERCGGSGKEPTGPEREEVSDE